MGETGYVYGVFGKAQFPWLVANGYGGGNYSVDGELVIIHRGSTDVWVECDFDLPKPSYVGEDEFPGWPNNLTSSEARDLTSRPASTETGSDGYFWKWRL